VVHGSRRIDGDQIEIATPVNDDMMTCSFDSDGGETVLKCQIRRRMRPIFRARHEAVKRGKLAP
jgi:hypothetical protein